MSLKIQLASDLHIEENESVDINIEDYIIPKAPILILAGDIGNLYKKKQLQNFLKKLSKKFVAIVYIPGNHEYYRVKNISSLPFYKLNFVLKEMEDEIVETVMD